MQIDTINVIERCHHHILWSRIPDYKRDHLRQAQSVDKTVFEYWTHALSYVPTADLKYFIADMKAHAKAGRSRHHAATPAEVNKILARIREGGALSIRDIDDDELVEKTHAWGSRKPSKRTLQFAFYAGKLVINTGGKVQPTGIEVVNTLYFGGIPKAVGTWGATGSGADFIDDARFLGTAAHRLRPTTEGEALLYGSGAGLVTSDVLVRLPAGEHLPPALLALGSRHENTFHPSQACELLHFLAAVIAQRVEQWLG